MTHFLVHASGSALELVVSVVSSKLVYRPSSMKEQLLHTLLVTLKADSERELIFERGILDQYSFEGKFLAGVVRVRGYSMRPMRDLCVCVCVCVCVLKSGWCVLYVFMFLS